MLSAAAAQFDPVAMSSRQVAWPQGPGVQRNRSTTVSASIPCACLVFKTVAHAPHASHRRRCCQLRAVTWLVVPVIRSCQSPIWIWLVSYLHLHLHLHVGGLGVKGVPRRCTAVGSWSQSCMQHEQKTRYMHPHTRSPRNRSTTASSEEYQCSITRDSCSAATLPVECHNLRQNGHIINESSEGGQILVMKTKISSIKHWDMQWSIDMHAAPLSIRCIVPIRATACEAFSAVARHGCCARWSGYYKRGLGATSVAWVLHVWLGCYMCGLL